MAKRRNRARKHRILRARLSPRGANHLNITWEYAEKPGVGGDIVGTYLLSCSDLDQRIREIRIALEDLVATAKLPRRRTSALRRLAEEGQILYETLMRGDARTVEHSDQFRSWFEKTVRDCDDQANPWTIEFVTKHRPLVPWGLTFTRREGRPISDLSNKSLDFQDFWCMRHRLSTYPESKQEISSSQQAFDGLDMIFRMIVEHEGYWQTQELAQPFIGSDKNRLQKDMTRKRDWFSFLYFHLRDRAGGAMDLGNELLTPEDLVDITEHRKSEQMFAFIDRDAIIRGDREQNTSNNRHDFGWIDLFFRDNCAGFLAAEADINEAQLNTLGLEISIELLKSGKPLIEQIYSIRKKFWPYSLLYGVYCNPYRFQVHPPPAFLDRLETMVQNFYTKTI